MAKINFLSPKKDRYSRARGGKSKFLNLSCSGCGSFLLLYQKDGPGILRRLYLDRIFAPEKISRLQKQRSLKAIKNLICPHCSSLIGFPRIYAKENRKSFHLIKGSFSQKRA